VVAVANVEAGTEVSDCRCASTDIGPSLDELGLNSGAGEVSRAYETIVSCSNDNYIRHMMDLIEMEGDDRY